MILGVFRLIEPVYASLIRVEFYEWFGMLDEEGKKQYKEDSKTSAF